MTWSPIKKQNLLDLLDTELSTMSNDDQKLFQQYAVVPFRISCVRTQITGNEIMFVVARFGKYVLVFDDVEDEFAIGIPQNNELNNWELHGNLYAALYAIIEKNFSRVG